MVVFKGHFKPWLVGFQDYGQGLGWTEHFLQDSGRPNKEWKDKQRIQQKENLEQEKRAEQRVKKEQEGFTEYGSSSSSSSTASSSSSTSSSSYQEVELPDTDDDEIEDVTDRILDAKRMKLLSYISAEDNGNTLTLFLLQRQTRICGVELPPERSLGILREDLPVSV